MARLPVIGRVAAAVIVSAVLLAGCGGGGGSSSGGGGYKQPAGPPVQTFTIDSHNFAFNPDKITDAKPGVTQITLTSSGGSHTLVFDGAFSGFLLEVNGSGDHQSGKVDLKPGKTYTFYCDLPGHRAQGMEGTITVGSS